MSSDDYARAGGFAGEYLTGRIAEDLCGVMRGILIDGTVAEGEVTGLWRWCTANPTVAKSWPGNVIVSRLRVILDDAIVDDAEREDLHHLLEEITACPDGCQEPGRDIYTQPPPDTIITRDRLFVLTGSFLLGPRAKVQSTITGLGGRVGERVTLKTNFLVVGARATPAWKEADRGNKILAAQEINTARARGGQPPIPIVAESCWSHCLVGGSH